MSKNRQPCGRHPISPKRYRNMNLPISRAIDPFAKNGGGERTRTVDLLVANQALSQLSYTPRIRSLTSEMVGLGRFELPTSRLSGVRSNQLSYRPPFRTNLPTNTARTAAGEPRDIKPSGARAPKPCRRRKRRFPANGARERKGCAGGGALVL